MKDPQYGSLITTDYVLDEVITTVWAQTHRKDLVRKAFNLIWNTPQFVKCEKITQQLIQNAWEKWEKYMENMPERPSKDDPLDLRLRGDSKTPSEWARLAQEAEKEERWGDAHYYWIAGSTAYTRNKKKSKQFQLNALQVFEKWQENS